jgi:mannosyl-3-phosphoglycerate synthase
LRIEVPHHTERFGAVRIHSVQEIWELDSGVGSGDEETASGWQTVRNVPYEAINAVSERMAIVVPCKDERLKVLDGVLAGIPHDCLIILVSNSSREPIDRYQMEIEQVSRFCRLVARNAVMVHQRDTGLALALAEAGLDSMLDDEGLVKNGKGEGMLIGLALAKLAGRDYVGYIDADNYVPGAVHEYCKAYAAGIHMAQSPYAMVRISWKSKPKVQGDRLFFNRWGRTSQVTNRFFNLFLAEYSGFGTDIVATGNAGEHAFTVALAERMRFGTGFSVEPYQFINLFEDYGGVTPAPFPAVMSRGVEIFQIETRNPHLHEDKGTDHVQEMRLQALNVLYHSEVCPPAVRDEIQKFLGEQDQLVDGEVPVAAAHYPPLVDVDWDAFKRVIADKAETFAQTELYKAVEVVTTAPIVFGGDGDEDVDLGAGVEHEEPTPIEPGDAGSHRE